MNELHELLKDAVSNFELAKKFYVEDTKTTADKFFQTIFEFLKDLSKAKEDNEAYQERVASERKKLRALAISRASNRLASNESIGAADGCSLDNISGMVGFGGSSGHVSKFNSRATVSGAGVSSSTSRNGHASGASAGGRSDKSEDFDDLLSVIKNGDLFGAQSKRGYRQSKITGGI